jgi:hypothetical protein
LQKTDEYLQNSKLFIIFAKTIKLTGPFDVENLYFSRSFQHDAAGLCRWCQRGGGWA